MTSLNFTVHGMPAAQGSKRHVGNGRMVESSKKVAPWRQDVIAAAMGAAEKAGWVTPTGPIWVGIDFYLPRPQTHYGTGKNAGVLKPTAPPWHSSRPDVDKLIRALFDALTISGVIRDDSQIAIVHVTKCYGDRPSARVGIEPVRYP